MTTLGPSTTPGTYEFQVLDQLHDPNNNRWSIPQIDGYINEARKQVVMDTGCLRTLQQSYITQGQEQYQYGQVTGASITAGGVGYVNPSISFSGGGGTGVAATVSQSGGAVTTLVFTNFGSGYSSAPTATITDTGGGTGATVSVGIINVNTFDMLGVNLYWGTSRYSMDWYPFRVLSAWLRPYNPASYQRQPVAWADYSETSIFVAPTPDQTYAIEFDTIILPTPLATGDTTTQDAIPPREQDPIKFYAAYLAKNNAQNYGEAEQFLTQYRRRVGEVIAAYTGRIPSLYGP